MSLGKKILLILLAIFILIQFFRPKKNRSAANTSNDIFAHYQASDTLKQLIKTSCYDCHSNNTSYPWYSNVQPVAWWLNNHVQEAKRKLNFSEFNTYPTKKADRKLGDIIDEVEGGDMPLKAYTLIHVNARLNKSQQNAITSWIKQVKAQINFH